MSDTNQALQKLQQSGLLPMLLQKMHMMKQASPSAAPGVGGAPPGGGQARPAPQAAPSGGPQVKFDPSGAGSSMPPPISQPHEAVQSIAGLLMNWNQRKKKGEEAEAANIAQNLIQALRNNDKDTVNDIMNNDHSKKILNKVYKGWLTKAQDAQKPGKEQDPVVSGFEAGIHKATSQQAPPPQTPRGQLPMNAPGGYRMPSAAPGDQLSAAKLSAETQAAKDDPNRLLTSQLSSGEMRETELGAGPEKVAAERAKAEAEIKKAASDFQRAQLDLTKTETELKIKQQEASTSKEKGEVSVKVENARYLKALAEVDVVKARLQNILAGGKAVPVREKLKLAAIDKAIAIASKVQDEKRSFAASDFAAMATELRAAGATEMIKRLPQNWLSSHFWASKDDVSDVLAALQHYKEGIQTGLEKDSTKKTASGAEGSEEGDEINADIVVNPEDLEDKKPPEK